MRVPLDWLSEYVGVGLDAHRLADRLALTGTEVERVERHGVSGLDHFVIGRVLSAEPHPDADRLRVCMVELGDGEPSQIVCGAPNVATGQLVAVARPGAVMPDGTKLKKAKLRGQESNGMILAEDELAIGTDHDGIMVLGAGEDAGMTPGAPLADHLPIATDVLVLEITPNRPDCLGLYGVAREVHAATGAELKPPPWRDDPGAEHGEEPPEGIRIAVDCPRELCPRFTARVFEEVTIAPSPPWLKARLMAAGQRPISNVVDITNYVMLVTGQPLHAFDLDRIAAGTLTVRRARAGETMRTLDGAERRLDEQMVLIADGEGPTSIAGVMGGERSEVHAGTTRILLEAATWNGANIHRTSLELGLRTEASGRFEKTLQPEQAMEAQALATKLLLELCGARQRGGTIDIGGPGPALQTIRLRESRLDGVLGAHVERRQAAQLLEALDFETVNVDGGLEVTVPAFRRADVTREADLIEEVARLDGLDKLPATLPSRHGAAGRLTELQRLRRVAADALTAQGLHEVVGWSLTSPHTRARLGVGDERQVALANPLSAELSVLRSTLLGSLLDVAELNRARGNSSVRLFEAGAVYLARGEGELPEEPQHLAALLGGEARPRGWRSQNPPPADFFAIKAVLSGLLERLRVAWEAEPAEQPFLHPGRSAAIRVGDSAPLGWVGEIHPLVAERWGWSQTLAAFELDLDALGSHARTIPLYTDLTSYPEVREDLAMVVDEGLSAASLLSTVRQAGRPLLREATVFDRYLDPQRLGQGKVSLALRLTYRANDRTLTDDEVAAQRGAIVEAVTQRHGGQVRGG